ncbi:hypothetical protein SASPL_100233 [Salvia splendens]|uniref:Protein kinase domain-containing protein n=1 Tax=Salvia splendens TaxID=180675 RepID=A0A8X8YSB8_SALSN|nr:hypothetical protein SASPL_100233 [Salvia splendens]
MRFGSVYKAVLDDEKGIVVAVKVVNLEVRGASKTFMAECRALGGIRHRNLVKLVSVCDSVDFKGKDFKALVYEFKVNGSLDKWLHNNEEGSSEDLKCLVSYSSSEEAFQSTSDSDSDSDWEVPGEYIEGNILAGAVARGEGVQDFAVETEAQEMELDPVTQETEDRAVAVVDAQLMG